MDIKGMTVGQVVLIGIQVLLVIIIVLISVIDGRNAFLFICTVLLSVADAVIVLWFMIVNWNVKWSEIDWEDPFDIGY